MIHLVHMVLFAGLLSWFFAFLQSPRGRRRRFAFTLWGVLVGAGFGMSLLMYPLS